MGVSFFCTSFSMLAGEGYMVATPSGIRTVFARPAIFGYV